MWCRLIFLPPLLFIVIPILLLPFFFSRFFFLYVSSSIRWFTLKYLIFCPVQSSTPPHQHPPSMVALWPSKAPTSLSSSHPSNPFLSTTISLKTGTIVYSAEDISASYPNLESNKISLTRCPSLASICVWDRWIRAKKGCMMISSF